MLASTSMFRCLLVFLMICAVAACRGGSKQASQLVGTDFNAFCRPDADPQAWYTVRIILRTLKEQDCTAVDTKVKPFSSISLPYEGLVDLRPLQMWTWFTAIDLQSNKIRDAAPLAAMTRLKTVLISRNKIESLDFARSLLALETLKIADNQLSDLQPLSALKQLKNLDLARNSKVNDLSPLASLPLRNLNLNSLPVGSQIEKILPLPDLTSLDLSGTGLTDVTVLALPASLPLLEKLLASRNQITAIAALPGLKHIRALDLSSNPILDVTPLAKLTTLVALDLSYVGAPNIAETLAQLHLKEVIVAGVGLKDLAWTSHLPDDLQVFDVSQNDIADVSALYRFKNISTLKLSGNPIDVINTEWLNSLPRLRKLEIDLETISDPIIRNAVAETISIAFARNRQLLKAGK